MFYKKFTQLSAVLCLCAGSVSMSYAADSCLGGASTGLRLSGAVNKSKSFTPASLSTYQTSKITMTYFSGKDGLVTKTLIGVPLLDLLNEAVVKTDSTRKNDILRKYLAVTATDCYQVVIALAEIQPNFGGEQAMVAFETVDETGEIVPLDDMRLVMPSDKAGGRNVSNMNSIVVRSAP